MRVVQVGCGKMSAFTMRYALERNAELVGAYDVVPSKIGQDVSTVIGGEKVGVAIESFDDLDASLKRVKPDIAIITTQSLMRSIFPTIEILAQNGVNGVSICEELFYGWDSDPLTASLIDQVAKAGGVTFTGSGYQDVSWGSMVTALAATAASIEKIRGISSYNLEDYGLETAAQHGAGLSPAEFDEKILKVNNVSPEKQAALIAGGEFLPGYMWPVNGWIASALGLNVTKRTQRGEATAHTEDLYSETLGKTIAAGDPTGLKTIVEFETAEGVTIVTECIGNVFAPGEIDLNDWNVEGEPDMKLGLDSPATVEMTCACCVNRMPDVIAADPGYVTSEKMPALAFRRRF
ncbi:MAG: dihydrodipicolinate reductase [Bifidobacteriaceae bacterium]|nr:dihydrodipicolinate reductase [Bifidobacteriaceae bacterium]